MENKIKNKKFDRGNSINLINKVKVLNAIRNSEETSRAELVTETGFSPPTVNRIVDYLIFEQKLVKEIGMGASKGGRPPKIIKFNGDNNYVIGIDWGRTHIHAALSDLNGHIIMEIDLPNVAQQDIEKDLQGVYTMIDYLLRNSKIEKDKLMGIGIAAPGFITLEGIVEYSPKFNWKNINLIQPIKEKFNVPVIINNVVSAMAIGEYYYGTHRMDDFIFVNIGHGIGCGFISKGNLLTGFNGIIGEFGHTKVNPEHVVKMKCECGKYNCLECFSSGWGIEATAKEKLPDNPESLVNILTNHDPRLLDVKILAKAANMGDEFSRNIFFESADIFGVSLANLANIFNPQAIILGGKVMGSGDFFMNRIYQSYKKELLPNTSTKIKLLKTSIPGKAAVKGAIGLILREVLNLSLFENGH